MARTPSTMLELGTRAPDFRLPEPATGNIVAREDFSGKPLLVAFICNHCPYVIHIRDTFVQLARDYQARGVAVIRKIAQRKWPKKRSVTSIPFPIYMTNPRKSPKRIKRLVRRIGFCLMKTMSCFIEVSLMRRVPVMISQ